ncbi:MAG: Rha family transcriptional regulator [Desulfovibrio sp.]|nr:Rha family transcriptional regulator [Desulfovibrio sp.]
MTCNCLSDNNQLFNSPLITKSVNGKPAALSTEIAEKFGKKHKHVLRYIAELLRNLPESFGGPNFGPAEYEDEQGKKRPAWLLTRDAFALLVMGFTGKSALLWKLRYIEAFNALEKAALENNSELAREAGYAQGRDEAMALPQMEAERKKAFLQGYNEGRKYRAKNDGLAILKKILVYKQKGLSYAEIGKLLGMSKSAVGGKLERARKSGLIHNAVKPVQAGLPGVM